MRCFVRQEMFEKIICMVDFCRLREYNRVMVEIFEWGKE